jgi:hypothetical protein
MVTVLRNQLFAILERGVQWLCKGDSAPPDQTIPKIRSINSVIN